MYLSGTLNFFLHSEFNMYDFERLIMDKIPLNSSDLLILTIFLVESERENVGEDLET